MNSRFLEKLLAHLDHIDTNSVQTQFLRLAKEQGLMETIFHSIQEGILVFDETGIIQYLNRAAESMLGIDREKSTGRFIQKYVRDIDWDSIFNQDEGEWARLMHREMEINYPEHRFVEFYVAPLPIVENKKPGTVMILRDVTRDREREAQTLESEKLNALMLLAAGVAHEIGNPLNSLNIHLQLIDRELENVTGKEQGNIKELLEVAQKEISRLNRIITQFLGAIRPSEPQLEPGNITQILDDILSLIHQEIEDRGIWVELEIPDALPPLQFDKGQIKQAFFNLIKNAIQAMNKGGLLRINARTTDRFVEISFTDNGTGIAAEDLGHIFEPYHSNKENGNGLGLMIVQRIIRDHGGLIEVDTNPGQGSTFTILLPREDQRIRLLGVKK